MDRKVYHVTPVGDAWGVRRARRKRADSLYFLKTGVRRARLKRADSLYFLKTDAVARAKCLAKAAPLGQVKVHGRNGRVQVEYTYQEEPHRTRG
jgi:hypothetical protein